MIWSTAHHCHSIGGQQLFWGHGGEVGNVGQGIDQGYEGDGYVDGSRQVSVKIDKKITTYFYTYRKSLDY